MDRLAVTDAHDEDHQTVVHDASNEAEVAEAVLPVFAQRIAFQRLADRSRVIEVSDPVPQEGDDAAADLGIELGERLCGGVFVL
jgi:hypothetical protein